MPHFFRFQRDPVLPVPQTVKDPSGEISLVVSVLSSWRRSPLQIQLSSACEVTYHTSIVEKKTTDSEFKNKALSFLRTAVQEGRRGVAASQRLGTTPS